MATVIEQPLISFGREVCGDLTAALRREWLVTNGLGGFASGTLAGIATRRYHGLLVAALAPPVGRTVLVPTMVEWAAYDGRAYPLSAQEYQDGTIDPHGYRHLESFALEGMLPVWRFALGDALLERRIWMAHGANTTYVTYRIARGARPIDLDLRPLLTLRDFHSLGAAPDWRPEEQTATHERGVTLATPRLTLRLAADGGRFAPSALWHWNLLHREERARGLDDRADLYSPGAFRATLQPDATLALTFSLEGAPATAASALAAAREGQSALLRRAGAERAVAGAQQLVLAADQFIARREGPAAAVCDPDGDRAAASPPAAGDRTIIAGYPWFNDWGRDTFIALPGLCLATGRAEDAAAILRGFVPFIRDGAFPNNFPDQPGAAPDCNTVDAALWYILAARAYDDATGDTAVIDDLLPTLRDVIEAHLRGLHSGIGVDPADGLLRAGATGTQLTWMDAKVGDWVVTPRVGKPVEINALWYNAVRAVAAFLKRRGDLDAGRYDALADRARASFRARFVRPDGGGLADVVDGPDGDDLSVRPNQIFAVALPEPLLDGADAAMVVDVVGRRLLTTGGLRSLDPGDGRYQGVYGGDQLRRDGAYHQGTAWTWLLGPYVAASLRVHGDRAAARTLLAPIADHLRDGGLGTVAEILDGDPPHPPRGCTAQAWGVAELLRALHATDESGAQEM